MAAKNRIGSTQTRAARSDRRASDTNATISPPLNFPLLHQCRPPPLPTLGSWLSLAPLPSYDSKSYCVYKSERVSASLCCSPVDFSSLFPAPEALSSETKAPFSSTVCPCSSACLFPYSPPKNASGCFLAVARLCSALQRYAGPRPHGGPPAPPLFVWRLWPADGGDASGNGCTGLPAYTGR